MYSTHCGMILILRRQYSNVSLYYSNLKVGEATLYAKLSMLFMIFVRKEAIAKTIEYMICFAGLYVSLWKCLLLHFR